jgi:hypothetical protein
MANEGGADGRAGEGASVGADADADASVGAGVGGRVRAGGSRGVRARAWVATWAGSCVAERVARVIVASQVTKTAYQPMG